MTTVLPFGALLLLAAFSDICVASKYITEIDIVNGTVTCTPYAVDKIFPTVKLNCTHDGLQATVDHGQLEGYVFVKGSRSECKQNLMTASISTTLYFSYSQCGIEDTGSIILVLKNHTALDNYRADHKVYECQGKSFHVWERMEYGTPTQTLDPAKYRMHVDRDVHGNIDQVVVVVEPASLYGAIVKNCWLEIDYRASSKPLLGEEIQLSDEYGCPVGREFYNLAVLMSEWFVDRKTDTLKATLDTTQLDPNATIKGFTECTIEACIGRCEVPKCKGRSDVVGRRRRSQIEAAQG